MPIQTIVPPGADDYHQKQGPYVRLPHGWRTTINLERDLDPDLFAQLRETARLLEVSEEALLNQLILEGVKQLEYINDRELLELL